VSQRVELPSMNDEEDGGGTPKCLNCKFSYNHFSLESDGGLLCRRYPPVLTVPGAGAYDDLASWNQPAVLPDDWCGEYKSTLAHPPAAV
jgi:hypothetical protein